MTTRIPSLVSVRGRSEDGMVKTLNGTIDRIGTVAIVDDDEDLREALSDWNELRTHWAGMFIG